ncbi:hypothetical protein JAAARDRAFT_682548 [Jaapia argillacea MUCL 33604]|uniref:Uncharacterized protein n=1 Tax=Jaapia argillacea MUCL 33604 TaxID=933084 RepID=A0A067PF42_9AGAM|nr:hypothetical protein JAAARDRAFT_682548 [Jaapia argillacea MUCL 33604]
MRDKMLSGGNCSMPWQTTARHSPCRQSYSSRYLDEFSKAPASEVHMLLGEVGRLYNEKRAIIAEMVPLLRSRLLASLDRKPPNINFGGPPPGDGSSPLPEAPPPLPEEPMPARPVWRTVQQRRSRRQKKPAAAPALEAPPPDTRPHVSSWATWQREYYLPDSIFRLVIHLIPSADPSLMPTPTPGESTPLLPERTSPGLFGPRSPRDSVR